jgi:hypothetical protein
MGNEKQENEITGAEIDARLSALEDRCAEIERAMVAFSSSCRDLDAQRPAPDGVPWSQRLQIHARAWDAQIAMARTTAKLNGGKPS